MSSKFLNIILKIASSSTGDGQMFARRDDSSRADADGESDDEQEITCSEGSGVENQRQLTKTTDTGNGGRKRRRSDSPATRIRVTSDLSCVQLASEHLPKKRWNPRHTDRSSIDASAENLSSTSDVSARDGT